MKECIGIINLDEKEDKLTELIRTRTVSSMIIAGRYKIIDFALSNLTNSGVESIGIFTKKKSYSLLKHLSNGRPWDLHRKKDGLKIFNYNEYDPSYDDIHSFMDNIEFIKYCKKEYIIIIPSYMVCNIDYKEILDRHKKSNNEITIIYKKSKDAKRFLGCEELIIDENNKVKEIREIDNTFYEFNVNMEMYIMKTSLFVDILKENITNGLYRKVKEYIKYNLKTLRVGGYEFKGYLSCINSVISYFNTNKEILDINISNELFYNNRLIFTKEKNEPPVFYSKESKVNNCIIANGSYVEGKLENCIIGRKVKIKNGAIVKDSIIMDNVTVEKNAIINNSILSSNFIVEENKIINGSIINPKIF